MAGSQNAALMQSLAPYLNQAGTQAVQGFGTPSQSSFGGQQNTPSPYVSPGVGYTGSVNPAALKAASGGGNLQVSQGGGGITTYQADPWKTPTPSPAVGAAPSATSPIVQTPPVPTFTPPAMPVAAPVAPKVADPGAMNAFSPWHPDNFNRASDGNTMYSWFGSQG